MSARSAIQWFTQSLSLILAFVFSAAAAHAADGYIRVNQVGYESGRTI